MSSDSASLGLMLPDPPARAIDCRSVSQVYASPTGPVHALDRIDLVVEKSDFVSVLGPSGCGKSTLMKLVAGLRRPTSGEIFFAGNHVRGPQTDVGIVFQNDALVDWRSALENVLLQIDLRGARSKSHEVHAKELLTSVGLGGFYEKKPFELSGGMRQRVSICRALVHKPPILLMDEPFGALDALSREQIMVDLQRLWLENAMTVLFITHSIQEAIFLSDRVVVMSGRPGRIVETIPVEFPRPRQLSLLAAPEFNELTAHVRDLLTTIGVFGNVVAS